MVRALVLSAPPVQHNRDVRSVTSISLQNNRAAGVHFRLSRGLPGAGNIVAATLFKCRAIVAQLCSALLQSLIYRLVEHVFAL